MNDFTTVNYTLTEQFRRQYEMTAQLLWKSITKDVTFATPDRNALVRSFPTSAKLVRLNYYFSSVYPTLQKRILIYQFDFT